MAKTNKFAQFIWAISQYRIVWDKLKQEGLFVLKNLILGSDLNFTVSMHEIWGASTHQDPLVEYFSNMISSASLLDVEPLVLMLTWYNGRLGEESISKCLDKFLILESLFSRDSS